MEFNLQMLKNQLSAMWRWRWFGVAICWVILVIGTIYVLLLPDQYRSEAKVYVNTDSVLRELMQDLTVDPEVDRQVEVMRQELLSRESIVRVIRETERDKIFGDAPGQWEYAINYIEQRVDITKDQNNVFTVEFEDTEARAARDVVAALLNTFVERNLGENRQDLQESLEVIESKLKTWERSLREAEQRVAAFQAEHSLLLGGTGTYAEKIAGARSNAADIQFKLEEAQISRDSIARQIGQTKQFLDLESAPQVIVGNAKATTTLGQISALRAELEEMKGRYTDEHPDVRSAKRRLDALLNQYDLERKGIAGPGSIGARTQVPNPLYEQLALKLVDANAEVGRVDRRLKLAQDQIVELEKMAVVAPQIEAQSLDLTRDYNQIKATYDDLLKKRERALLTRDVDNDTPAVTFDILQEAFLPARPVGPPRILYLAALLVIGLGGGVSSAYLRGQMEDSFPSTARLQDTFGLPVVGSVSLFNDEETKPANRRLQYVFFGAMAATPVVFIGAVILILPLLTQLRA
ncbi:MAG: XrtA system polysaccharide chain length determinant [Pseudomonadota bacterium]